MKKSIFCIVIALNDTFKNLRNYWSHFYIQSYGHNLCPLKVELSIIKGAHWADICVLNIFLLICSFFVVNISDFSLKRILILVLHLIPCLNDWSCLSLLCCSAFCSVLFLGAAFVLGCHGVGVQTCMTWSYGYTCVNSTLEY